MHYRGFSISLLLLAVVAAVCGCTSTVSGQPSAAPGPRPISGIGADPVQWVDRLCNAVLLSFVQSDDPPTINSSDSTVLRDALSTYFAGLIADQQRAIAALGEIGSSPTKGGDQAKDDFLGKLTNYRARLDLGKQNIDSANVSDPASFDQIVGFMVIALKAPLGPDYSAVLLRSPTLRDPSELAPGCLELKNRPSA